jgi:SARP family transcriptional regulator, regulator of embCAB operon
MQICVLGTISIVNGTSRIELPASKVRTILAVVALQAGTVVSCTTLTNELWVNQPPPKIRNSLQAGMTRARRVLDSAAGRAGWGNRLRSVHNGYILDVPQESIDCIVFEKMAAKGRAVLREHPRRAIELFESALQLWRGSALVNAGEGLLCRSAADQLEEAHLTLWEDLVSARIMLREGRLVLPNLRQFVQQYPLRERFCELLMFALYQSGSKGEALEAFHRTRRCLGGELGLEPRSSLCRLYQEILVQDPVLMTPDAVIRWQQESG